LSFFFRRKNDSCMFAPPVPPFSPFFFESCSEPPISSLYSLALKARPAGRSFPIFLFFWKVVSDVLVQAELLRFSQLMGFPDSSFFSFFSSVLGPSFPGLYVPPGEQVPRGVLFSLFFLYFELSVLRDPPDLFFFRFEAAGFPHGFELA